MNKQAKRRIEKGILAVGILLVMLVMATGSASAHCNQTADASCHGCCYVNNSDSCTWCYECGDTVTLTNNNTKICVFDQDKTCPANGPNNGIGLQVGANGASKDNPLIIDGAGYAIDGSSPGTCGPPRSGIYNPGYDNVTIKNLEIKNFCWGIKLSGTTGNYVENNTIDNCKVHDNGNASTAGSRTNGIELYSASHCNITNTTVYNNTGYVETSCGTGGHGIRLYGADVEASWAGYHNRLVAK